LKFGKTVLGTCFADSKCGKCGRFLAAGRLETCSPSAHGFVPQSADSKSARWEDHYPEAEPRSTSSHAQVAAMDGRSSV
jgi:hypothetical protein